MFRFLRGVVIIAAIILNNWAAFASEDMSSANVTMRGCREVIADSGKDYFLQGVCSGIVVGLPFASPDICAPSEGTPEQAIRVVVKYIDDRPARLNEKFLPLALEALRAAWPCKN
jgi:hypothetical protein